MLQYFFHNHSAGLHEVGAKFCMRLGKVFVNLGKLFVILDKLLRTFGQYFCRFGLAWASVLGKFAFLQTGLGNFTCALVLERTLAMIDRD